MIVIIKNKGFTLVEIAIVLIVVGLMMSAFLMPLAAQIDQRNYIETQRELSEIRDALIGFALSNTAVDGKPYLPCPDSNGDGFEDRAAGVCVNIVGVIPWATLGIGRLDRWGNVYLYRVTQGFANSNVGFTLGTPRDIEIRSAAAGPVIAVNVPAVIVSKGKTGAGAGADELENSDGDTIFVDRTQTNVAANAYDDAVIWLPSAILYNRMVTAGRLP